MQSTRPQLSWSQWSPLSGKDLKGLCHRRTPRDRAVCASAPRPAPLSRVLGALQGQGQASLSSEPVPKYPPCLPGTAGGDPPCSESCVLPGSAETRQGEAEGLSGGTSDNPAVPVPQTAWPAGELLPTGSIPAPRRANRSQSDGREFASTFPCWEEGSSSGTVQVEILTEGGILTQGLLQLCRA